MAIDPRKSKAEVAHQTSPKGAKSRCELCISFVHPDACKVVKGPMISKGWCMLFGAKARPSTFVKMPAPVEN